MRTAASSHDESPLFFRSGEDELFGILTRPRGRDLRTGVLLLNGGSMMPCTHRNAMYVRLARALSGLGYKTLRMDYHGVGESTGSVPYFYLNQPHVRDAVDGVECLRSHGIDRLVMLGTCFGGRTALAAAKHVPELAGLALVATPVEDYTGQSRPMWSQIRQLMSWRTLARMRDLGTRAKYAQIARQRIGRLLSTRRTRNGSGSVSLSVQTDLEALVERGVPVLFMYGRDDVYFEPFKRALDGGIGHLIAAAGDLFDVTVIDGQVHAHLTLAAQESTLEKVEQWLRVGLDDGPDPTA